MNDEELKSLWQSQAGAPEIHAFEQLQRDVNGFRRLIVRRNLQENIAAVAVACIFGFFAWQSPRPLLRIGCGLMVLGSFVILYQLKHRASLRTLPPESLALPYITYFRQELARQRHTLRYLWLWYVGAIAPGICVILWGLAQPNPADFPWGFILALFAVPLTVVIGMNLLAARKIQRKIEHWITNRFETMLRSLLAALLLSPTAHAANPPADCAGLPRLTVQTAPGFCVGLVTDGLKAARGLAVLPGGDIVVADMGSWEPGHGRIWLLKRTGTGYVKTALFDHLDRPNGVARGPDGNVYVGMPGRVVRFTPGAAQPVLADVIGGASGVAALPGRGRHLLPAILFDAHGDLLVSVGSASDHCEDADGRMAPGATCAERTGPEALGVIRTYAMQWPAGKAARWEVTARGLRNSMAMAVDARTGQLWQGENGRDAIQLALPALKNDDELPHDELNAITPGADYGWPYCYDDGVPSPEYPAARCRDFRSPARLLPAHAAPLGMVFYTAGGFPAAFQNSLVITYHGYRKHGHRIVALLDEAKRGPLGRSVTLVTGERGHGKGLGAPVGIATGADGDLYISDDHEGIVARLHYEGAPAKP